MNIHRIGLSVRSEVLPITINTGNSSRSRYLHLIGPGHHPFDAYIAVTKDPCNDCVYYRRISGGDWLPIPTYPWGFTL